MHINKYAIFMIAFFYLGGFSLMAQQAPVAAGGEATGSGGAVSYSMGQIDYMANSGSNGNTNEGLQQPYEFFTMGIDEDKTIQLLFSAYPNPSSGYIFLSINKTDFKDLSYRLFDMNGKALAGQEIINTVTEIGLSHYSSASYILKIFNSQQEIKTFKIIKK